MKSVPFGSFIIPSKYWKKIFFRFLIRNLLCLFPAFFLFNSGWSQGFEFFGTALNGGPANGGVLYKTDSIGEDPAIVARFPEDYGHNPSNKLCLASNGKFYGTCPGGALYQIGPSSYTEKWILFEYDASTKKFTILYEFGDAALGSDPNGLIEVSPGVLLGTTKYGGTTGGGTVFDYDIAKDSISKRKDFATNIKKPVGVFFKAASGALYILTQSGGSFGGGSLAVYNYQSNSLSLVKSWGVSSYGGLPSGGLLERNGKLWFLNARGGKDGFGSLCSYDFNTSYLDSVFFNGTFMGGSPSGKIFYYPPNGKFYGTVKTGGANGLGGIFKYDPVIRDISLVSSFDSVVTGYSPSGELFSVGDTIWYGCNTRKAGPVNGVIYSFDPGNTAIFPIFNFTGDSSLFGPSGYFVESSSNELWSTTVFGGNDDNGTIYSFDLDNGTAEKQFDFYERSIARSPIGSVIKYSDNILLGTTLDGGIFNKGTIYSYDFNHDIVRVLYHFDGPVNGENPTGRLLKASNGKIYGTTELGGSANEGVVFEFEPESRTFKKLHEFDWFVDSSEPYGGLVEHSNGLIYGTTTLSANHGGGEIFAYNPTIDSFFAVLQFPWTLSSPFGRMIDGGNGKLYGLDVSGGFSGVGAIFEFDPQTNQVSVSHHFSISDGAHPYASLFKASNGKLYGTTWNGGSGSQGVLFDFDLTNDSLSVLHLFTFNNGGILPQSTLNEGTPLKLYGTTTEDGPGTISGTLFEYDIQSRTYTLKFDFDTLGVRNSWLSDALLKFEDCNNSGPAQIVSSCDSFISGSGQVYYSTGTYFETFTNKANCDSMIQIDLTIANDFLSTPITSCDSFFWNQTNRHYLSSGFYYDTLTNAQGCDSVLELDLTIHQAQSYSDSTTSCGPYYWSSTNSEYDSSGVYLASFLDENGCDSTLILNLTVNSEDSIYINVLACDSFYWDASGQTYFNSGLSTAILTNQNGCDSSLYLDLTLGNNLAFDTVSVCDTFYWSVTNQTYFQSGAYTGSLINSNGCDSTIYLELSIGRDSSDQVVSACDSFFWSVTNQYYGSSGVYEGLLINNRGCDSIISLDLQIEYSQKINQSISACDSLVSPSGMNTWVNSGIYFDTLQGSNGCDSVLEIDLDIFSSSLTIQNQINCDSFYWPILDSTFYSSGTYSTVMMSSNGCDSIMQLDLTLHFSSVNLMNQTTCDSFYWGILDTTLFSSGLYRASFQDQYGCDSIIEMQLVVNLSKIQNISDSFCQGELYQFGSLALTDSGNYSQTFLSSDGCDSLVQLELRKIQIDTSILVLDSGLLCFQENANYQWLDCSTGFSVIPGENSRFFAPPNTGVYSVVVQRSGCADTSSCIPFVIDFLGKTYERNSPNLFPNPAREEINISQLLELHFESLKVISQKGEEKAAYQRETLNEYLQISNLPSGGYLILLEGKNIRRVFPFIKED